MTRTTGVCAPCRAGDVDKKMTIWFKKSNSPMVKKDSCSVSGMDMEARRLPSMPKTTSIKPSSKQMSSKTNSTGKHLLLPS